MLEGSLSSRALRAGRLLFPALIVLGPGHSFAVSTPEPRVAASRVALSLVDVRPTRLSPSVSKLLNGDTAARRHFWLFLTGDASSRSFQRWQEMEDAIRDCGAAPRWRSRWLNAVSVAAPVATAPRLGALPFVTRVDLVGRWRRVEPVDGRTIEIDDRVGRMSSHEPARSAAFAPDPYGNSRGQAERIGAVTMHDLGYTGAGLRIAMLDGGFRTDHPATRSIRVIAERDFVFNDDDVDNESEDWPDAWVHGTLTWSEVGGYDPGHMLGIAYGAEFLLAKTEDIRAEYPLEEDNYIAALEWAESMGARVTTASLAYFIFDGEVGYGQVDLDGQTIPLSRAVETAVSHGLVVLNGAGNSGPAPTTLECPADAPHVVSVGAVDSTGVIMSWSSRGPTADGRIKPEVVAQGWSNWAAYAPYEGYARAGGTSLSTPLIAGAVALLLEAHPDWSSYRVRAALMETADKATQPDNAYGYGLANVAAAAALEPSAPPLRPLPFALLEPAWGDTVRSWSPVLRWSRETATGADSLTYSLVLSWEKGFCFADTIQVGSDTCWVGDQSAFSSVGGDWYWMVIATNKAGWARSSLVPHHFRLAPEVSAPRDSIMLPPSLKVAASPNPLGPRTALLCQFPMPADGAEAGTFQIAVHDVAGRIVRHISSGSFGSGTRDLIVPWDGRNDAGSRLAPGIYFVRLRAGLSVASTRVVIAP